MNRTSGWAVVLAAWLAVSAWTAGKALERYREFRTGWSWDLAYYNQWFWTITRGDGMLSVRPFASFAVEGPPAWKTNYLAPVRVLLLPAYAAVPGPETLLVVHAFAVWLVLPAGFGMVRTETGSTAAGLGAAGLIAATPLLWPLAFNDFRELQMALPFAVWALQGVRTRSIALAALGVAGVLACRQEFGLFVASLAMVPPRVPEPLGRRSRWTATLFLVGVGWLLVVYLAYLRLVVGEGAPGHYLAEFGGPKPGLLEGLVTAIELALVGLGAWSLLAGAAPRLALLVLPWLWSLAAGRWALGQLGTEQWHHVRYAAPFVAAGLAVGLVGYARVWRLLASAPAGRRALAGSWTLAMALNLAAGAEIARKAARIPRPIDPAEAAALRGWIARVGPEDGVLAHYDVTAPLSSRRALFSYVLEMNKPAGYPDALPREIGWVFVLRGDLEPEVLQRQGFEEVHPGRRVRVFRRAGGAAGPAPGTFPE